MAELMWAERKQEEEIRQGLLSDRAVIIDYVRENGPSFASEIDAAKSLPRGRAAFVAGRFNVGYFRVSQPRDGRGIFIELRGGL